MDLCERLLSLPFFESEDTTDDFILFIFECHGVTVRFVLSVNVDFKRHSHMREQNADTLALIFNLFNLIGHIHPNLCRRLGDSEEWMEKLHSSFLDDVQSGSVKSHPAIAFVLNEILSAQELSMDDLARCFGEDVVSCVLGRIEKERENEVYCYSLIRLLVCTLAHK